MASQYSAQIVSGQRPISMCQKSGLIVGHLRARSRGLQHSESESWGVHASDPAYEADLVYRIDNWGSSGWLPLRKNT